MNIPPVFMYVLDNNKHKMPILFVSLNEKFAEKMAGHGFDSYVMKIQDFRPPSGRKTYYVSPANSLCFMDGGID